MAVGFGPRRILASLGREVELVGPLGEVLADDLALVGAPARPASMSLPAA